MSLYLFFPIPPLLAFTYFCQAISPNYQTRKISCGQTGRVEGELVGQLKMVPLLLEMGMTVEQIAERIGVDVGTVRQAAQSQTQA
jgi:predicted transposase YdaD